MEFISAEDFLKQPEKVQIAFFNWWEPSIGDLFRYKEKDEHDCIEVECIQSKNRLKTISLTRVIPLLTECQLRKFIEDKTGGPLEFEYKDGEIKISIYAYSSYPSYTFEKLGTNLFKAYWKVAVQIASSQVNKYD